MSSADSCASPLDVRDYDSHGLFNAVELSFDDCLDCFNPLDCHSNPWRFHVEAGLDCIQMPFQITFKEADESCSHIIELVFCDVVHHDFVFDCFHDSGFGLQYLLHQRMCLSMSLTACWILPLLNSALILRSMPDSLRSFALI